MPTSWRSSTVLLPKNLLRMLMGLLRVGSAAGPGSLHGNCCDELDLPVLPECVRAVTVRRCQRMTGGFGVILRFTVRGIGESRIGPAE